MGLIFNIILSYNEPYLFSFGYLYLYGHTYLVTECNVLPLLFPEVPWFTPDTAKSPSFTVTSLHRIPPSEQSHSLRGTSAPLNDSKRMLFSITWHSFPWRLSVQLSKGFQLLLAQGLCFYKSLWFMNIHHESCSNVLGSWLIPLNIKRTSLADITNRA